MGKAQTNKEELFAFSAAKKMAQRFLTERRLIKKPRPHVVEKMTEEALAKELEVKLWQLKAYNSRDECKDRDKKIALALINLYCDTSWEFG